MLLSEKFGLAGVWPRVGGQNFLNINHAAAKAGTSGRRWFTYNYKMAPGAFLANAEKLHYALEEYFHGYG